MNPHSNHTVRRAFTLIELLVVIAIIAVLAGLLLAGAAAVRAKAEKNRARTELTKLALHIDQYQSRKGFYPPGNQRYPLNNPRKWTDTPLFYELSGTVQTNLPAPGFATLNGAYTIATNVAANAFGMLGFMNSSPPGGDQAYSFLQDVKLESLANINITTPNSPVYLLAVPLTGPREVPVAGNKTANVWHYNPSSPTNNPNSYDLWVDILTNDGTNRVSNWSDEPVKVFEP